MSLKTTARVFDEHTAIIARPTTGPRESWWIAPTREAFQCRAQQEQARLSRTLLPASWERDLTRRQT